MLLLSFTPFPKAPQKPVFPLWQVKRASTDSDAQPPPTLVVRGPPTDVMSRGQLCGFNANL